VCSMPRLASNSPFSPSASQGLGSQVERSGEIVFKGTFSPWLTLFTGNQSVFSSNVKDGFVNAQKT
jgi:hypothetical protein